MALIHKIYQILGVKPYKAVALSAELNKAGKLHLLVNLEDLVELRHSHKSLPR